MTFRVSNYSVGQYLLVWERCVSKFAPAFVFIVVADYLLKRTLAKYEYGFFPRTSHKRLWVRPTFRLEGEGVVREPPEDTREFERLQDQMIRSEFDAKRLARRRESVVTHYLWDGRFSSMVRTLLSEHKGNGRVDDRLNSTLVDLNLLSRWHTESTVLEGVL